MDMSALDDSTFLHELKNQDPDERPLLDSATAARIIKIFRKVACQMTDSMECEEFESILGIIFEYVVQQRGRSSTDTTSPDLKFLLESSLVHALSDVYLSLFPQIGSIGAIAERLLESLFKTMLCIFEEHSPAKREFASLCLHQMYQDWFAPGYNAHPAAVFHMMEVVEALFADDDILNRFLSNHDSATEKARLLLRFAFHQANRSVLLFRQSMVLFSLMNNSRLNTLKDNFLEEAISLANITSIPEGVSSKKMFEAFQLLRHRGANTIDDTNLNKISRQLLEACKIVYRPYHATTLWLNTNEFIVRHFEVTRRGLSALIVPHSDPELEPEFLFTDRRILSFGLRRDPKTVMLTLSTPLHPCLSKHFDDSEEEDSDQDISAAEGQKGKGEKTESMLMTLEFKTIETAEEFCTFFQAQSAEEDFSTSQRSDVPRSIRPICDIAVMDKDGNPVFLPHESDNKIESRCEMDTVGNSTVFGSQGASISVCPDSLAAVCDQSNHFTLSQGSNIVSTTQDEENILISDPSYCQEKCITADSITALGIDEHELEESNTVKKGPKRKGSSVIRKSLDKIQDGSIRTEQTQPDIVKDSPVETNEEYCGQSKVRNVSESSVAISNLSFPKLGKKAESLSVKELKIELGKRGQPIDGNKKDLVGRIRKFESDSAAQIMKLHVQASEILDSQDDTLFPSKETFRKSEDSSALDMDFMKQTKANSIQQEADLDEEQSDKDLKKKEKTRAKKIAKGINQSGGQERDQTPAQVSQVNANPVSGPISPRSKRPYAKSSNGEQVQGPEPLPNLLTDSACQKLRFSPDSDKTATNGITELCKRNIDRVDANKSKYDSGEQGGLQESKVCSEPSICDSDHVAKTLAPIESNQEVITVGSKASTRPYSKIGKGKGKVDLHPSKEENDLSTYQESDVVSMLSSSSGTNAPRTKAVLTESNQEVVVLPLDCDVATAGHRSRKGKSGHSKQISINDEEGHDPLPRASRSRGKKTSVVSDEATIDPSNGRCKEDVASACPGSDGLNGNSSPTIESSEVTKENHSEEADGGDAAENDICQSSHRKNRKKTSKLYPSATEVPKSINEQLSEYSGPGIESKAEVFEFRNGSKKSTQKGKKTMKQNNLPAETFEQEAGVEADRMTEVQNTKDIQKDTGISNAVNEIEDEQECSLARPARKSTGNPQDLSLAKDLIAANDKDVTTETKQEIKEKKGRGRNKRESVQNQKCGRINDEEVSGTDHGTVESGRCSDLQVDSTNQKAQQDMEQHNRLPRKARGEQNLLLDCEEKVADTKAFEEVEAEPRMTRRGSKMKNSCTGDAQAVDSVVPEDHGNSQGEKQSKITNKPRVDCSLEDKSISSVEESTMTSAKLDNHAGSFESSLAPDDHGRKKKQRKSKTCILEDIEKQSEQDACTDAETGSRKESTTSKQAKDSSGAANRRGKGHVAPNIKSLLLNQENSLPAEKDKEQSVTEESGKTDVQDVDDDFSTWRSKSKSRRQTFDQLKSVKHLQEKQPVESDPASAVVQKLPEESTLIEEPGMTRKTGRKQHSADHLKPHISLSKENEEIETDTAPTRTRGRKSDRKIIGSTGGACQDSLTPSGLTGNIGKGRDEQLHKESCNRIAPTLPIESDVAKDSSVAVSNTEKLQQGKPKSSMVRKRATVTLRPSTEESDMDLSISKSKTSGESSGSEFHNNKDDASEHDCECIKAEEPAGRGRKKNLDKSASKFRPKLDPKTSMEGLDQDSEQCPENKKGKELIGVSKHEGAITAGKVGRASLKKDQVNQSVSAAKGMASDFDDTINDQVAFSNSCGPTCGEEKQIVKAKSQELSAPPSRSRPYSKSGTKSKKEAQSISNEDNEANAVFGHIPASDLFDSKLNPNVFDDCEVDEQKRSTTPDLVPLPVAEIQSDKIQSPNPKNNVNVQGMGKATYHGRNTAVDCDSNVDGPQEEMTICENMPAAGKKRNHNLMGAVINENDSKCKKNAGTRKKQPQVKYFQTEIAALDKSANDNLCKMVESNVGEFNSRNEQEESVSDPLPYQHSEKCTSMPAPKLIGIPANEKVSKHPEECSLDATREEYGFHSFDARGDGRALESEIGSKTLYDFETCNDGTDNIGGLNLNKSNCMFVNDKGQGPYSRSAYKSNSREASKHVPGKDESPCENLPDSRLRINPKKTSQGTDVCSNVEETLRLSNQMVPERTISTEIVYSSERGGTDTEANSDRQTNKSTTSTVIKGDNAKRSWSTAFSSKKHVKSSITCDSDTMSAVGLDDVDNLSVNGSEVFSLGSAMSPLVPVQLQFASARENSFLASNICRSTGNSVMGESESEGDDIESGWWDRNKSRKQRESNSSIHVVEQLNHLCALFAQKQGESLKSQAKEDNARLLSRAESISNNYSRFANDLEAKSRQALSKFREQRSKILQRSWRLVRDYTGKANIIRKRILLCQKKLGDVQKANSHIRKEKLASLMSRTKKFRDIQAAEEKRIKHKAQTEESSSSSNMQQIQALLGTFFAT